MQSITIIFPSIRKWERQSLSLVEVEKIG